MRIIKLTIDNQYINKDALINIKKFTNLGFFDIKQKIINNSEIYHCNLFDIENIKKLSIFLEYLNNNNIKFSILKDDIVLSLEYLNNFIETYHQIEKETEENIDNYLK